jgi:hypothetical protein
MKRFFRVRYLLVLIIALIVATGVLGFAASNTVPVSGAGDGSGGISGYTVSNISYVLAADPSQVAGVTFAVDRNDPGENMPTTVKIQISPSAAWTACSLSGGTGPWAFTCTLGTPVSVVTASSLHVVAAQ